MNIFNFLQGKKTYIVAIIGLLYGIAHMDMQIIEISILGLTGRAAISNLKE